LKKSDIDGRGAVAAVVAARIVRLHFLRSHEQFRNPLMILMVVMVLRLI